MENYRIITFQDDQKKLEVIVSKDTNEAWLNTEQIALLFSKSRATIYNYITLTYERLGLSEKEKCLNFRQIKKKDDKVASKYYRISFVLEIGKSLKSNKAIELKNYLDNSSDHLSEIPESIVYYNGVVSLDVKISPTEETVWLTQNQIADLFETSRPNISMHIQNIFQEGELTPVSVSKDFLHTASDGKQYWSTFYNLDLILAIGYRVKSKMAIEFRKWVSNVLKQYLIKGYAIDNKRASISFENILRLENDVAKIKEDIKCIKEKADEPKAKLFYNGQYFDAYEYICSLLSKAKSKVVVIDPYFDKEALNYMRKVDKTVKKRVYLTNPNVFSKEEIEAFNKQYGSLQLFKIKKFHDRFIILDGTVCYAIGTSLNHVGNKTFAICKIETPFIITSLQQKISKCNLIY